MHGRAGGQSGKYRGRLRRTGRWRDGSWSGSGRVPLQAEKNTAQQNMVFAPVSGLVP